MTRMREAECLFCQIAQRTLPATIVAETDQLLAFQDVHPQAPTHLLIIPTTHLASLNEATLTHTQLLGELLLFTARLAKDMGLHTTGYRLVTNCGAEAGQSVSHLHVHLLGGRRLTWPPG